jgi:hypothetical protein
MKGNAMSNDEEAARLVAGWLRDQSPAVFSRSGVEDSARDLLSKLSRLEQSRVERALSTCERLLKVWRHNPHVICCVEQVRDALAAQDSSADSPLTGHVYQVKFIPEALSGEQAEARMKMLADDEEVSQSDTAIHVVTLRRRDGAEVPTTWGLDCDEMGDFPGDAAAAEEGLRRARDRYPDMEFRIVRYDRAEKPPGRQSPTDVKPSERLEALMRGSCDVSAVSAVRVVGEYLDEQHARGWK